MVATVIVAATCSPESRLARAQDGAKEEGSSERGTREDAHSNDAATPPRDAAALDKARALFDRGQIHYSLGEYDEAIARFREAYELSSAPGLLFNIAQAHRLKGDCPRALEIYHHFMRLASDSPYRSEAEVQVKALTARCPPHPAPGADVVPAATPSKPPGAEPTLPSSPPPLPGVDRKPMLATGSSTRTRIAKILLVTGVVVATGTGLLYWWNDSRHDHWATEDRALAAGPGSSTSPSTWIARQNQNDDLLRSIRNVDTTVVVLAGISAAAVLGSATLGILSEKGPQVAVGPSGMRLAFSF